MTIFGDENPTSYFSSPAATLDPTLFEGRQLRSWVRTSILHMLRDHFGHEYQQSDTWSHAWLAGSGVSYQWSADRQPGDLDCLVGVNFVQFRKANPEYRGLTDKEIAAQINEGFRSDLQPTTQNWNGYELTFYVNATGTDIRNIKPYAAYDLKYNEWTVTPSQSQVAPHKPEWESVVHSDYQMAHQAHTRATKAVQDLETSHGGPAKRNSEVQLQAAYQQAAALYEEIHGGRKEAFSQTGEGYLDFHNYRWQASKRTGTADMLRQVKSIAANKLALTPELPDAATLVRRAALYRAK